MRDLGYVEGRNLAVEWRFAEGSFERLSGMATDLVQMKVDVIVAVASAVIGRRAEQKAGVAILVTEVSTDREIETAFASMAKEHASALIVGAAPFFSTG